MATPAQIDANRRNARKSTGPRTVEGKSASSANSLRHGLTAVKIFPAEDQAEFDALAAEYGERFQPLTVDQRQRVDAAFHADWNLRRQRCLYEEAWQALRVENPGQSDAQILIADLRGARVLDRLLRYQRDLQRTYDRAVAALNQDYPSPEQAAQDEITHHRLAELELEAQRIASATFESLGGVHLRPTPQPDPHSGPPPEIGFVSSPQSASPPAPKAGPLPHPRGEARMAVLPKKKRG